MPDIAAVPGVGAAEAAALAALGLHTTEDLLRTERGALVRRVPNLALIAVKGWQSVAELAQLRDLPLEDAARLHAAGFDGVAEVAGASVARLRAALPHLDEEALLDLARDAVRLRHTGVVNGNVRLRDGTPVEGARAVVYGTEAVSDARGRFRVIRLPLDRAVVVTVHHASLGYRTWRAVPVVRPGALEGRTFELAGRRQVARVLSERRGDRLPPLAGSVVVTRAGSDAPGPEDVLAVLERRADGVRVVSRFLDFEDGRFVRRTHTLPADAVPASASTGSTLAWSRSGPGWAVVRMTATDLRRRVRLARARRSLGSPPADLDAARAQAAVLARAASDPGSRS